MSELFAGMSNVRGSSQRMDAEIATGLILLDDHQRSHRQNKRIESLIRSWPIIIGIFLSLCAPMLRDLLENLPPWGMWLVFPFVSLSERPEMHLGSELKALLPQIVLYLQFPFEGYCAKRFLKGRVTLSGVAGQVFLYHFLGVVQLLLVCTALGNGVLH
ncbi:MAG TPA: hypothetical protein VLZ50_00800 [Terracidiphilus sp.]|nr:hypothetical protein [Terracidiphilus sp.]